MFRETLQTLVCLSVLVGTSSLHMVRDSYRRPMTDLDDSEDSIIKSDPIVHHIKYHDLSPSSSDYINSASSNSIPTSILSSSSSSSSSAAAVEAPSSVGIHSGTSDDTFSSSTTDIVNKLDNDYRNLNENYLQIPKYMIHKEPPRALQELFADQSSTLDIRLDQEHQKPTKQYQEKDKTHRQQQMSQQQKQQSQSQQQKKAQNDGKFIEMCMSTSPFIFHSNKLRKTK